MAVRKARWREREALVALASGLPARPALAWVLAPAAGAGADLQAAAAAYHRWLLGTLLAAGTVLVDGAGSVAGGRPHPLSFGDRLGLWRLALAGGGRREGRYSVPDLPEACVSRMAVLTAASLPLRPPGRVLLVPLWGGPGAGPLLSALRARARARHLTPFAVAAAGEEGAADLEAAGFVSHGAVEAGEDSRPPLVGWWG